MAISSKDRKLRWWLRRVSTVRPYSVLLAWVTVDGALYQPPTPSATEGIEDVLQDLQGMVGHFKQDRLEAGLSLVDAAPAVHATDVYGKLRFQLALFYKKNFQELDANAAAGAATPKANTTGAHSRCAHSPTNVTGDPLHDTLAIRRLVSAVSPDASNCIHDHKDLMCRLSQTPLAATGGWPRPQPLPGEHWDLLVKVVEMGREEVQMRSKGPRPQQWLSQLFYSSLTLTRRSHGAKSSKRLQLEVPFFDFAACLMRRRTIPWGSTDSRRGKLLGVRSGRTFNGTSRVGR